MAAVWARTATVGAVACAVVLGVLWGSPATSGNASEVSVEVSLASGESPITGMVLAWKATDQYADDQATVPAQALSGATAVSAGAYHSLALKDGGVIAWGSRAFVPEGAQSGITAIAAGGEHSLALKAGEVIAWGDNSDGQIRVPDSAKSGVTSIAAGFVHSLALKDGGVIAWGSNMHGRSTVPDSARSGITSISAGPGGGHSLALTRFGEVVAWGYNEYGQTSVPEAAKSGVTAIAAGSSHSLALKGGRVLAWGADWYGQSTVPEAAKSGVTAIAAGSAVSLALKDGEVIAWGRSDSDFDLPVPAVARSGVVAISAGSSHVLALRPVLDTPRAPSGVSGVPGDGQIQVSWEVSPASEPARSFAVTSSPEGRGCTASTTEESCLVNGLTNGVQYTFTVVASNDFGASQASAPSPAVAPRGRPVAPQAPTVVAGNGAATVSWYPPAKDGGYPISGYLLASSPGNHVCATTSALSCTVTGLTNGVAYTFSVAARNQAGTSPGSPDSAPVTPSALLPTTPLAITGAPGDSRVAVSWQPPTDAGDSPITGYTVTASPGNQSCTTTGALTCTVAGLTNGTPYTFTVSATNATGTSLESDPSSPVTPARPVVKPGAVTSLKATARKGAIRVTWAPPTDLGGATAVTYQYRVGKQAWKPATGTSVTVNGKKGTTVAVSVRAVNEAGAGPVLKVSAMPK